MTEYAHIEVTTKHLPPFGNVNYAYRWVGDPISPVIIDRQFGIDGLPWKLKKLRSRPEWGDDIYVRVDGWRSCNWIVQAARLWIINTLALTKTRIILTFVLWGMGYAPPEKRVEWRDIFQKRPGVMR